MTYTINLEMIHAALQFLAGMCDGARARDGHGFNGRDTEFGKSLAAAPCLSFKQAIHALKILRTYRNSQLPSGGFDFNALASIGNLLITFVAAQDGDTWTVEITDGIPPLVLDKLYQKFQTKFDGTSKEDAIAKMVAELKAYNMSGKLREVMEV